MCNQYLLRPNILGKVRLFADGAGNFPLNFDLKRLIQKVHNMTNQCFT